MLLRHISTSLLISVISEKKANARECNRIEYSHWFSKAYRTIKRIHARIIGCHLFQQAHGGCAHLLCVCHRCSTSKASVYLASKYYYLPASHFHLSCYSGSNSSSIRNRKSLFNTHDAPKYVWHCYRIFHFLCCLICSCLVMSWSIYSKTYLYIYLLSHYQPWKQSEWQGFFFCPSVFHEYLEHIFWKSPGCDGISALCSSETYNLVIHIIRHLHKNVEDTTNISQLQCSCAGHEFI